uniref:Protein LLP homolog n=2 Tax=Caenorhabditis japonica TaxID=281687 RepID=A0A8R1DRT1_CAEJA
MAKSLRSKFKRKVRAIARTKKEPKTAALLQKAVEKRDQYEKVEAEKTKEAAAATGEKMEVTGEAATINTKTLRKPDGSFPSWLSGTQKKKAAKKSKAIKKSKNKTAHNFR